MEGFVNLREGLPLQRWRGAFFAKLSRYCSKVVQQSSCDEQNAHALCRDNSNIASNILPVGPFAAVLLGPGA